MSKKTKGRVLLKTPNSLSMSCLCLVYGVMGSVGFPILGYLSLGGLGLAVASVGALVLWLVFKKDLVSLFKEL